jgi:hypothetical protein
VPNILRIRVLAEREFRIASVMRTMGLSREQAKKHITEIDAGREKWVRFLYGVDWHDPTNYDMVVHLDQMGLNNAVAAALAVAQQTDFDLTPQSMKAVKNLYVGNKAHLELSTDQRTSDAHVRVSAHEGRVQVICPPEHTEFVPFVEEVLSALPEINSVDTTIARKTIVFLQEEFADSASGFVDVVKLAKKWKAAVDLVRFSPLQVHDEFGLDELDIQADVMQEKNGTESSGNSSRHHDVQIPADDDLDSCLDILRKEGCLGASSTFCGSEKALLSRIRRTHYAMIALGDVFTSKPEAIRIRLREELKTFLSDKAGIPVVDSAKLATHLKFGAKQIVRFVGACVVAASIFVALFSYQSEVIAFLSAEKYEHMRIPAVLFVVGVSSLFAYAYGTLTNQLLRLFRLD